MSPVRHKINRKASDISQKVTNPTLALIFAAVAQAIATGDFNAPEIATAISAAVTAIIGYFTHDKIG